MANKHRKVWKVVSRKLLSGKQTQPKGKTLSGNQTKFFFDWKVYFVDWKVFSLDQLSNGKQTRESLENGFPKIEFQETNMALMFV